MEIRFFSTVDGKCPFVEWLDSFKDRATRGRIEARLRKVSLGHLGDAKPVGEGVSELRLDFGPGYRVYFAQIDNQLILLLAAGDKSTQTADIGKAKKFLADFRKRTHDEDG